MKIIVTIFATSVLLLHIAATAEAQSYQTNPSSGAPSSITPVFSSYFEIQKALAGDSLTNVQANSIAIADGVRQGGAGVFRPELVAAAEALAAAPDLESARQIFKAVSGYLIQANRAGNGPGGMIHEMHSPVGNVNWLQREDVVQNPFVGKSDPLCGEFVN